MSDKISPTTIGWVATLRRADGTRFPHNGSFSIQSSAFKTQQQASDWAWAHTNSGTAYVTNVQSRRVASAVILDANPQNN